MIYYLSMYDNIAVNNSKEYDSNGFMIDSLTNAATDLIAINCECVYTNKDTTIYIYNANKELINTFSLKANILANIKGAAYIAFVTAMADEETQYIELNKLAICYPHFKKLTITKSLDDEKQIFKSDIGDKIKFLNADFDYLSNLEMDKKAYFYAYKNNNILLKADIDKSNITFDFDNKIAEVTLEISDEYTDFEVNAEEEFNITELGLQKKSIYIPISCVLQSYIKGSSTMQSYQEGESTEVNVDFDTDIDADLSSLGFKDVLTYIEMKTINYPSELKLGKYFKGTQAKMTDGFGHALEAYDYYGDRCFYKIGKYKTRTRFPINLQGVTLGLYEEGNVGTLADISLDFYIIKTVCQRMLTVAPISNITGVLSQEWGNYKYFAKQFNSNVIYSGATSSKDENLGTDENDNYLATYPGGYAITPNEWSFSSMWFLVDINVQLSLDLYKSQFRIDDFYNLGEVIKKMGEKIGIKHDITDEYSKFLYGDNNIEKFTLYITQKSNVVKANYTQAAVKASTSINAILEMLRYALKAYYFIDSNRLKIEHISYLIGGKTYQPNYEVQLDISSMKDLFNKKSIGIFQSKISYNKVNAYRKYKMSWMDEVSNYFGNQNVIIDSNFVDKENENTINISNFTSDVNYIFSHPDDISNDGFVIVATDRNSNVVSTKEIYDNGKYIKLINGMLSWRYIFEHFYVYDLPAERYYWEKGENSVGTAKKLKKTMQQEIEFNGDIDIDPYKLILTSIGAGSISSIERNIITNHIKLTLTFEPK